MMLTIMNWIEGNVEPGNVTGSCTGTRRWAAAQTFASQPEIFQENFLQISKICLFFQTIFAFVQNNICICAKQDLHLCKTRFALVQNKICIFAKQDLHFCKTIFAFVQNNICISAKEYLHLCKTRFAFATHLWTCPLEHVVRSSSLVVGSGQAAMFKNHFCNSFVWICF